MTVSLMSLFRAILGDFRYDDLHKVPFPLHPDTLNLDPKRCIALESAHGQREPQCGQTLLRSALPSTG